MYSLRKSKASLRSSEKRDGFFTNRHCSSSLFICPFLATTFFEFFTLVFSMEKIEINQFICSFNSLAALGRLHLSHKNLEQAGILKIIRYSNKSFHCCLAESGNAAQFGCRNHARSAKHFAHRLLRKRK